MTPSDLVALVARLGNYNPPDRAMGEDMQIAQDIWDAKDAIEQLQAELADCHRVITIWDASDLKARPAVEQYARAERAETERDALRAELATVKADAERLAKAINVFTDVFPVADIERGGFQGEWNEMNDAYFTHLAAIDAARAQATKD